MARKSWHNYFMDVAQLVSTRATCDRLHVGAVIVKDKRIIATGYNGAPSGMGHCDDVGHLMVNNHCVRTIHGEQNAILQCAKHGVSAEGATLYLTHYPCDICAKLIIGSGIKEVYYASEYKNKVSEAIFQEANLPIIRLY